MKLVYFFQQGHFSKLEKSYLGRQAYLDICIPLRVKYEAYGVKGNVSTALMRIYSLDGLRL